MKKYNKQKKVQIDDFGKVSLRLASPERILEWSRGEVTRPETMNYRTQRSEKHGLFDEKIFGPEKNYECYCGKYRGIRYKGIICDKCGVEVTNSIVRRERMGHITLATPVSHIWFLRSIPSRIAMVLGMSSQDVENVVYFAGYLITEVNESERKRFLADLDTEYKNKLKSVSDDKTKEAIKELFLKTKKEIDAIQKGAVIDEVKYHSYSMKYGSMFDARIGAEAVYDLCKNLDLVKTIEALEKDLETAKHAEREKLNKRLSVLKAMQRSGVRPEWMFLVHVPIIPPALRPMVALDGGRHATSDVNDLYRRVINRNNRLKRLMEIKAPDVILRNEKRILQEAVDALIDNSLRQSSQSYAGLGPAQRRTLKSLSDNLSGKRGLFRSNLLGKRVDYSGRSVIVVGPDLKLNQCGLPKLMALELFRPFIIAELLKQELAFNIRGANRLIDDGVPEVWEILENVIKGKYVLLNRAPTLHRLGIQAFQPVLIEGSAIQVHPLVCTAFNADFDGDQMPVHIPLSEEAQFEAREIMASDKNILKPGSGELTISAKLLDIILGVYWMTRSVSGEKGEGKMFCDVNTAITTCGYGEVGYRAKIKILAPKGKKYSAFEGQVIETTVGRILFNEMLPDDYPFINETVDKKYMAKLSDDLLAKYGIETVSKIFDDIKNFGFKYATRSGVTWGIDDVTEPEGKSEIIRKAQEKVDAIHDQYNEGLLSEEEKTRKVIEVWHMAKNELEKLIPATLQENGPVYDMVNSGARGSMAQITIMAGMKGLIQSTTREPIEFPVLSSSKAGLTPIEYFITTHGSRKGLTDTALNTAKAGYLTRRLFDVAQDIVINKKDCGTKEHIVITSESEFGMIIPLHKKIKGRVLAEDVVKDGNVMFKKNHLLTKVDSLEIEKAGIEKVAVFSPLTCKCDDGICAKCYGLDLGRNELVDLGEAVGTVAAQAIGEPGTQLTMRTFHAGGAASVGGDITQGLPRVEEIFEKRQPKNPAVIAHVNGVVSSVEENGKEKIIMVVPDLEDKGKAKKGKSEVEYTFSPLRMPLVKLGDKVEKGQFLTDGSADLDELFKYAGREKTQNYIIHEISKLYELQGDPVSRKHIEVIVKQMFSRRKVKQSGDTIFQQGDVVSVADFHKENNRVKELGKEEAIAESVVMGITNVALSRASFLSAASFQNTTRVLIRSAIRGAEDDLKGLKENVIIGRLIPAGTGFTGSKKFETVQGIIDERNKMREEEEMEREVFDNTEDKGE